MKTKSAAALLRTKQCPKCPTKVATARKKCTNCDHVFYERKTSATLEQSLHSVASILHVRDGGQVIGYTRRMRAIKQSRFFNQQTNAALNNSIIFRRDSLDSSTCAGRKVIFPDQPSPVAPQLDAMPYYGPMVYRHHQSTQKKWRLPKSKAEAAMLVERERRFFAQLPPLLQRASDRALAEINFRLTGPRLVQQPRLYPNVM